MSEQNQLPTYKSIKNETSTIEEDEIEEEISSSNYNNQNYNNDNDNLITTTDPSSATVATVTPSEIHLQAPSSTNTINTTSTSSTTTATPFAAPSLEGWPPASQMIIPPPIRDVIMTDSVHPTNDSPPLALSVVGAVTGNSSIAPSPVPSTRTNTPRTTNGNDNNARASSQYPDPAQNMPKEAPPHGAPIRRFLNENITGILLEGLKIIVKDRPSNPLRVLGEYLIQRSKELNHP